MNVIYAKNERYLVGMVRERVYALLGLDVPDLDCVVGRAGDEVLLVRGVGHAQDPARVAGKGGDGSTVVTVKKETILIKVCVGKIGTGLLTRRISSCGRRPTPSGASASSART